MNEIELRRWDTVRVCVARRDGQAGRRYQGGVSWYDVGTADHALVNTAVLYRWFGEELRAMVASDAADGNVQLQQRYNWIKNHLYDGVEYNGIPADGSAPPRSDRNLGAFGRPSR